jgi:hypothetical protein
MSQRADVVGEPAGESDREGDPPPGESHTTEELRAEIVELRAANDRLRERYESARRTTYERTALGLAGVGIAAGVAGLVVTTAQQVLFSVAAIGLFAGVLTRFLTPERFIPEDVGHGVYAALAENEAAVCDHLGLAGPHVYLDTDAGLRLFVPERESYELPDGAALADPFVVTDDAASTGASFRPAATDLLDSFERTHRGTLPAAPGEAATHLGEGLAEGLELAGRVETDVRASEGRATFEVTDARYGDAATFDHPVRSFLAAGMARSLECPVECEWATTDDALVVTVRWTVDERGPDEGPSDDVDAAP